MSKTTRFPARKSAEPNAARTSDGPNQAARSTIENQRRRGCSASGCFFQNSISVCLLKILNHATLPRSHSGSKAAAPGLVASKLNGSVPRPGTRHGDFRARTSTRTARHGARLRKVLEERSVARHAPTSAESSRAALSSGELAPLAGTEAHSTSRPLLGSYTQVCIDDWAASGSRIYPAQPDRR